jgi:bifunctional oligoribonuclease and PAP phosphatase NrnA
VSTVEADTRAQVLDELRDAQLFVLVTHENPDGDALGSLVAMHRVLLALGKDSVMYMAADEFPLPYEYRFFELDGLQSTLPVDLDERTIVFLDCGNIDRNPVGAFKREEAHILNIDHHHDNTRFGTVNHVVEDASCTAEIVWDLMRALSIEPTIEIAEALYVGLVTDTGKFMYENTGTRAHVMAAELIEAGVDVHGIYRRLYEGMPYAKLELLARALARVQRYDDGRLTFARLTRDDFRLSGAEESYSEGIIDHLRSVEGTKVAALTRELLGDAGHGRRKVSLRATDGEVDVSVIARAARRPGSPRRCPRRSSSASCASRSRRSSDRRGCDRVGRPRPRRQAGGEHLARPDAGHAPRARRPQGRPCRHARPVRHRPAARAHRARAAGAALPDGAAQAVRHRRAAGRDLDHR